MKPKKKILIITNLYPLPWEPNRATFNKQQFTYLANFFELYILVPIAWPHYFKNRRKVDKDNPKLKYVPYFYIPKTGRRFYPWFMFISLIITSFKWIKSIKANAVFASWAYPDGVSASKLAKLLDIPFFLKVHGSDINEYSQFPPRAIQIINSANYSNGVIAVSQALADKMGNMGVHTNLINVIYNGVDQNIFYYDKKTNLKNNVDLLFVGNLKKTKGVIELLECFNKIHKSYPDLTLTYVGTGETLAFLKQKVNEYNIEEKVSFLGSVKHKNLGQLMHKAKFLVLPSYNEGVPNVILEAMSCGIPVIATDIGGIPEVVINEITGILIDTPTATALYTGFKKAMSISWDSSLISKKAERFDWNTNISELNNVLENI